MSSVRSMNGINNIEVNEVEFPDGSTITSAQNLVQLDTNNNFTSNNTFNVNLPTSNVNPELNDINNNTMLNKHSADKLYDIGDEISSVSFNTNPATAGLLTLTRADATTITGDLDGRYMELGDTNNSTNETIFGVKTFNEFPIKTGTTLTDLTPTADGQLTPKKYLDHKLGEIDSIIDEIRDNVYDDAEITTANNVNTLTLKRPDGGSGGNTALTLPQTSLSTCVLKTTDQTIDDVKTFTSFPVKSGTTTPTTDGQLATKKYVDDNAGTGDAVLNGANVFTSTNTFNTHRPSSSIIPVPVNPLEPPNPAQAGDFIMKRDGDLLYLPITNSGVAFLDGNNDFGSGQGLGSNSFNPRPTTTLTNSITAQMFITKNDAENRLENVILNGDLNVSSGVGANGKCILTLEADTDNSIEASVPQILFKQDGGYILSAVGVNLLGTTDNELSIANGVSNGGITFYTGTDGGSQGSGTKGYELTTERMKIAGNGDITITDDLSVGGEINQLTLTGTGINRILQSSRDTTNGNVFRQECPQNPYYDNVPCEIGQNTSNSKIWTFGKIGAGTAFPTCVLDARGTTKLTDGSAYIYLQSSGVKISRSSTSYMKWGNGGHHIDSYTTSSGAGRRMYINYYANQGVYLNRSYYSSDDRIKEEEKFIENATDTLLKLRPQTYIKYAPIPDGSSIKPNFDLSGNFESGLIAQEIYYDAPELRHIVEIEDDKGDKIIPSSDDPQKDPDYSDWGDMAAGVDYIQLIPYLIKSNQELHERILKLEEKINM